MKNWHLALGVKTFPAGPSTTNKLFVWERGSRGGREKKGEPLATPDIWNLDQPQEPFRFVLMIVVLLFICLSFTGTCCWEAEVSRHSAVLLGVRAARPGIWLSVIIASLPRELLDAPDSLWTYYCDTPVSGHWCERQSIPGFSLVGNEIYETERGIHFAGRAAVASAWGLMIQQFPLQPVRLTLWTWREIVHQKIIFMVLPCLLFPVVFAWKCFNKN